MRGRGGRSSQACARSRLLASSAQEWRHPSLATCLCLRALTHSHTHTYTHTVSWHLADPFRLFTQLRRRHFKSSLPQLLGPLLTRLLGDSGCKARGQLRCLVHMSEHCLGSLSDADISNAVVALIDAGGGHQGDANVCAEVLSLVPGALVKVWLDPMSRP
jgi:hypothetical protein